MLMPTSLGAKGKAVSEPKTQKPIRRLSDRLAFLRLELGDCTHCVGGALN